MSHHNDVSADNPCPFLRALVQRGLLPDDRVSIGELTSTIVRVAREGEGRVELPSLAIRAIALIANGLGPLAVARSALGGVQLDALRGGPLDKKGAGSGILDEQGAVSGAELERLSDFARQMRSSEGEMELGLDAAALTRMMNENFARARGSRRSIDRRLMEGEWPVLLKVMGKDGPDGRYLSIAEVCRLFADRALPERMMTRLDTGARGEI